VQPGTAFDSGLTKLYAFFDYQGMQDGWSWTRRWYIDGDMVIDTEATWEGGDSGNWWVSVNNGEDALPDGEYTMELLVEGQVVQSASCTIGEGTGPRLRPKRGTWRSSARSPTPLPVRASPGRSLSSSSPASHRRVPGTEEEVYTYAETDNKGNYTLHDMLVRARPTACSSVPRATI